MVDEVTERRRHDLEVTVNDEDDGSQYVILGNQDHRVGAVVEVLYDKDHLNRERRSGDRLRCDGNGDDVFAHLDEQLEHFRKTHCDRLVWNFVGDQGGAAA